MSATQGEVKLIITGDGSQLRKDVATDEAAVVRLGETVTKVNAGLAGASRRAGATARPRLKW